MTIEKLEEVLEGMRSDYELDAEQCTGDEAIYANGQLAMLDQILKMLSES